MRISSSCNAARHDVSTSLTVGNTRVVPPYIKMPPIEKETTDSLACSCNVDDCKFCDATMSYISGLIVTKMMKKSSCDSCKEGLLYSLNDPVSNVDLIALKNRGGLVNPSGSVLRLVKINEKSIRKFVLIKERSDRRMRHKLQIDILGKVQEANLFETLTNHDLDFNCDGERHSASD